MILPDFTEFPPAPDPFTIGDQPCCELTKLALRPEYTDEMHVLPCPKGCGLLVVFCTHCNQEHHQGGYNLCLELEPFGPPAEE